VSRLVFSAKKICLGLRFGVNSCCRQLCFFLSGAFEAKRLRAWMIGSTDRDNYCRTALELAYLTSMWQTGFCAAAAADIRTILSLYCTDASARLYPSLSLAVSWRHYGLLRMSPSTWHHRL